VLGCGTFSGPANQRVINAGQSITLEFDFQNNASTTASLYSLMADFGSGLITLI
jgi:hypothetical protein